MHKTTESAEFSARDRARIQDALERILSTDKFHAAPQMSAFLRYVVEQAASGHESRIKAYTVAIDALGKPESFDPQNDPVVRVLAGRLRACLQAYSDENPTLPVKITMQRGTYVPGFVFADSSNSTQPEKVIPISDELQSSDASPVSSNGEHNAAESGLDNQNDATQITASPQPTGESSSSDTLDSRRDAQTQPGQISALSTFAGSLLRFPAAAVILGILGIGVLANQLVGQQEASHQSSQLEVPAAALPSNALSIRQRPESLSVFVNASDPANSLESQLNTMISGVFSESEQLRVYRMLDPTRVRQYWPEDYIVSLDVLAMPDETRVNVQLISAETGQISYSKTLFLSADAEESLSRVELSEIMALARYLVGENGPMASDYQKKMAGQSSDSSSQSQIK